MAKPEKNKPEKLTFYNRISPNFRSVHVDGAYGGITPTGLINLNFFSERFTIPKSSTFIVNDDETLGEKIADGDDSIEGVLRHYEIGIFTDIDTARKLAKLLLLKIDELEKINNGKE